jgi:cholest-4-en-3-one 26-monooxygenase
MPFEIPEEAVEQQRLMMLNMDPPLHTRYRRLVNKGFTPRTVAQLHDRIHVATDHILDAVIETGEADFVTDIAAQLPLVVIAELLGVPSEERDRMFSWSNRLVGSEDPEYRLTPEAATEAALELYAYAAALFAAKRAEPKADLMSVLAQVEVDGEQLSALELELFFLLLTIAGNETTRNLISGGMLALIEHPDQRSRLQEEPSLLDTAVEEMLRWVTPVIQFRRTAVRETEIGGQPIAEGDKVVIYYSSANRDETVFDDAERFDVARSPNEHLTFGGGGHHFCLGANLARLEIRLIFAELLRRLPDIELDGPVRRLRSNFINGIKEMPVRFAAAPARS